VIPMFESERIVGALRAIEEAQLKLGAAKTELEQWFDLAKRVGTESGQKHCPFCQDRLAELTRRVNGIQQALLRQNLTFGSD
jgi:hypothetical protein